MERFLLTFNEHGAGILCPALACFTEPEFERWKKLRIIENNRSIIISKETHKEILNEYTDVCQFAEDLITIGLVKVTNVNRSFYELFHSVNLSRLSLCHIFDI